MDPALIVISGEPRAGKSKLVKRLGEAHIAIPVAAEDLAKAERPQLGTSRAIRAALRQLDAESNGTWLAQALAARFQEENESRPPALDSAATVEQLTALRKAYGARVLHVHLFRDPKNLQRKARAPSAAHHADMQRLEQLAATADVLLDVSRTDPDGVFARVLARLGQRPSIAPATVDVIIGGQYGSEGKGNIAAHLAPEYDVLVRVGGPNAGHKVFREEEAPDTFHQLPSGAKRNHSAKLVIGAGAVISLEWILKEIGAFGLEYDRILIDPQAMIIEGSDIRWEERNLRDRIASTAQGVGRASARKILHRWPDSDVRLAEKAPELKRMIGDTVRYLEDAICQRKRIMLEGTQGTSLSLHHGFYPHVTSRITTSSGCIAEAGFAPCHINRVIMVCRTFPIRVGDTDTGKTSGFMSMPTTLHKIAKSSGLTLKELKRTERTSTTNRPRRIAHFDWMQLRRSAMLNGPTDIALTFADYLSKDNKRAFRYEQLTPETRQFIEEIEKVTGVPVSLVSTDFSMRNVIDRRAW